MITAYWHNLHSSISSYLSGPFSSLSGKINLIFLKLTQWFKWLHLFAANTSRLDSTVARSCIVGISYIPSFRAHISNPHSRTQFIHCPPGSRTLAPLKRTLLSPYEPLSISCWHHVTFTVRYVMYIYVDAFICIYMEYMFNISSYECIFSLPFTWTVYFPHATITISGILSNTSLQYLSMQPFDCNIIMNIFFFFVAYYHIGIVCFCNLDHGCCNNI